MSGARGAEGEGRLPALFFLVFIENFLFLSSQSMLSMLPPYLESLGASKGYVGLFSSANALVMVLALAFFGRAVAAASRRRALVLGFALYAASMAAFYFLPADLTLMLALRLAGTVSWVFAYTINMNVVYDLVPARRRLGMIAFFGISGLLTNPVGALLGEWIEGRFGPRYLFPAAGAFALLALALSAAFRGIEGRAEAGPPLRFRDVASRKDLRSVFAIAFLFGACFAVYQTFLPGLTRERLGFANLSAFFVPFTAISVALRFLVRPIFEKLRRRTLLLAGFITVALSFALVLLADSVPLFAAVGLLYGIGHSLLFPLISTIFVDAGGDAQKAAYNNAFVMLITLGSLVLAPALGVLGDLAGTPWIYAGMLALSVLSVGVSLNLASHRKV